MLLTDWLFHRLETAIPLLQQKLSSLPDAGSISIAFPDDGAYKRFHMYFDSDSIVICNKVRDKDKRIVKVKEGRLSSLFGIVNVLFSAKLLLNV